MRSTLFVLLLVAAAGCAHARKEAPPAAMSQQAPPVAVAAQPKVAVPAVAPSPASCRTDDQCSTNELCQQAQCVAIDAGTAACNTSSTHFDFDRALIRESDFPVLQREARCLQALPSRQVRIEGNCDERGTTAYNLVLGQRRASADQKYLENLGISKDRISTVSYGKERPLCRNEVESCWAKNRRDDLVKVQ